MREPTWISSDVAIAAHRRLIAEHGGSDGVRDHSLLESALGKPKNLFAYGTPTLAEMAASYGYGIARNHPFIDGNKRTAMAVSMLFMHVNGRRMTASQQEAYLTFLALGEGSLSEEALAQWFAAHTA